MAEMKRESNVIAIEFWQVGELIGAAR